MRRLRSYPVVIAAMVLLAQVASATPSRPQAVVVVTPLVPYVAAILGNAGEAQALLRPEQDAHRLTLSPSQIERIEQADFLIIPDLSMSPFIANLAAKRPKLQVVELSKLQGAEPLPYAEDNLWLATSKKPSDKKPPAPGGAMPDITPEVNPLFPNHFQAFGKSPQKNTPVAQPPDPHFWLDPERMATMAPALAGAFAAYNPGAAATYQANAGETASHLRNEVMPNLQQLLSTRHAVTAQEKEMLPFVTSHGAYQYFLDRFKLPNPGSITARPEDYRGAATMASILEAAKTTHIRCLMAEIKTPLIEKIARLSSAKIILLSPEQRIGDRPIPPLDWIKDDYDRLMYDTAKAFGECL